MKKIIVFGGDGFCGWPTSLYLSALGHDVIIVDNFSRRTIDEELQCESLTPIQTMDKRVKRWRRLTHDRLFFKRVDIAYNYHGLVDVLRKERPDAIVHFAEQRAAPYSMKSGAHKLYTVRNNILATHNLLCAIVELKLDTHVVHLGTAGVYGYGGDEEFLIPEGYVTSELTDANGRKVQRQIMFPADPGSIYHMTKVMDSQMFYYYNKNNGIPITDLHQGIVWGTQTEQTALHDDLINRFDYDGDYGTVLNRFLMQGICKYPLTIYGTGEQTRAFIHVKDMCKCIDLAIKTRPAPDDRVHVFNQTTEQLKLSDLAEKVALITNAEIRYYNNPRFEAEKNNLTIDNTKFMKLGLKPTLLNDEGLSEVCSLAYKYRERVNEEKIICTSTWRDDIEPDFEGMTYEQKFENIKKVANQ
jgi:UDP-sulfoquinovose synthase